jgi:2-polyprenyl-6-methoxyphenol hydroxylase-like FAD-dependent oxidoreductase
MARNADRNVIVIGAGPAGLTAAIGLRRVGIPVAVYEQATELGREGIGLGVQSNALRGLERLGVARSLLGDGVEIDAVEVRTRREKLLVRLPQQEVAERFGTPTISILRWELRDALLAALGGDDVHLGRRCVGLEQDEDGVTVRFADGREERAALVVGADGMHSHVARTVLGDVELDYTGLTSWRCVVTPDRPTIPPGTGRLYVGRGRMNAMFPAGRGRVYGGFMIRAPQGRPDPPDLKAALREWFADFPEGTQAVLDAVDAAKLVRADIFDRVPSETWFKGRIVLAGDAIHPTTPFVGQGAGIAIEDGFVLAKELGRTDGLTNPTAIEAALRAYQARRVERARWIVLNGRRRGRVFGVENRALVSLRDLLLGLVPASVVRRETERLLMHEL